MLAFGGVVYYRKAILKGFREWASLVKYRRHVRYDSPWVKSLEEVVRLDCYDIKLCIAYKDMLGQFISYATNVTR